MKLSDVVRMVDDLRPNSFAPETKTAWINEVEGMIQTEIMLLTVDSVRQYEWQDDQNVTLLVKPPHDKLYAAYLTAMIDFANGEYDKYANSMAMFNEHYGEFERWFSRTFRPARGEAVREGYYIVGFSPEIECEKTETGAVITIRDAADTSVAELYNGQGLPPVTSEDDGCFAMVSGGIWTKAQFALAEEEAY